MRISEGPGYGTGKDRPDDLPKFSGYYRRHAAARPATGSNWNRSRRTIAADRWVLVATVAVAAAVLLAAIVSGAMDASNTTLVVMGFDPDRAQLITSLLIGAVASAGATLATGRFRPAMGLGFVGAGLLFAGTFSAETAGALGSNGVEGAFDPGGWARTLITLVMSAAVASWSGAALASTARPWLALAAAATREAVQRRSVERRALRYPIVVTLVVALLAMAVPTFGDLVNFAPDSLMRAGAAPQIVDAPTAVAASPTTAASSGPSDQAAASTAQAPTSTPKPWLAWLPTGAGLTSTTNMAAPWKGGTATAVDVTVYTPPGYRSSGSRRYPVLYEAPTGYHLWDGATNVKAALDTLIDSGAIPATIVVFIDSSGGPFPDTECANSLDHRQWFDTFVSQTVVGWVDSHYQTMAEAAARAVAGMSEGGYCAAILALHHPDTFGTSISFSGYYQAGAAGSVSQAPFEGSKSLIAADSPTVVAAQLDAATRAAMYFIVIAKPDQPSYGPEAAAFEKTLATDGYSYDGIVATEPHGWPQVRDYFPPAVEAWAARELAIGVF